MVWYGMVWYGIGMQDVKRMMENRAEVVIKSIQNCASVREEWLPHEFHLKFTYVLFTRYIDGQCEKSKLDRLTLVPEEINFIEVNVELYLLALCPVGWELFQVNHSFKIYSRCYVNRYGILVLLLQVF